MTPTPAEAPTMPPVAMYPDMEARRWCQLRGLFGLVFWGASEMAEALAHAVSSVELFFCTTIVAGNGLSEVEID